jgi:hypothetical protein
VLNASLWDVMSTGLSRQPGHVVDQHADELRAAFYALMRDTKFIESITYSPNDTIRVKHRFEVATARFKEVWSADAP